MHEVPLQQIIWGWERLLWSLEPPPWYGSQTLYFCGNVSWRSILARYHEPGNILTSSFASYERPHFCSHIVYNVASFSFEMLSTELYVGPGKLLLLATWLFCGSGGLYTESRPLRFDLLWNPFLSLFCRLCHYFNAIILVNRLLFCHLPSSVTRVLACVSTLFSTLLPFCFKMLLAELHVEPNNFRLLATWVFCGANGLQTEPRPFRFDWLSKSFLPFFRRLCHYLMPLFWQPSRKKGYFSWKAMLNNFKRKSNKRKSKF